MNSKKIAIPDKGKLDEADIEQVPKLFFPVCLETNKK
jgi:hypothetical protein